jgi:hypothetical protein
MAFQELVNSEPFIPFRWDGIAVVVFKVPRYADHNAFRHAFMTQNSIHTQLCLEEFDGDVASMMNEWWDRFLFQLPENQKYW